MRCAGTVTASIVLIGALAATRGGAAGASADAVVWTSRYDGVNLLDRAHDIPVSPGGAQVFVTGVSNVARGESDFATIAYDAATGTQQWLADYDGPGTSYDSANAIGVSPDGSRVYVTGSGTPGFTTVAYDATSGTQLWVARYAGGTPEHLLVSPDGTTVFVTGDDQTRWHTIAYDAATGAQQWIVQFVPGSSSNEHAAVLSSDGSRIFVTGDFYTFGNQDYATVAYDALTGGFLWSAVWDDGRHGDDHTRTIGVSPDGSRVFVAGMAQPRSRSIFNTIAYDAATGLQEWVATYDNRGSGGHHVEAVGASLDNTLVFVTGPSWGNDSMDYATVGYDAATGAQVWVARYNDIVNGTDSSFDLGVDPAGDLLYVTGRSEGEGTGFDYATVAYEAATGSQVWEERYEGPSDDEASALAVGTNGSVFVTGTSKGADAKSDYLTMGRLG